jgi:hypothetical protein
MQYIFLDVVVLTREGGSKLHMKYVFYEAGVEYFGTLSFHASFVKECLYLSNYVYYDTINATILFLVTAITCVGPKTIFKGYIVIYCHMLFALIANHAKSIWQYITVYHMKMVLGPKHVAAVRTRKDDTHATGCKLPW